MSTNRKSIAARTAGVVLVWTLLTGVVAGCATESGPAPAMPFLVLGTRPTYSGAQPAQVPNGAAIQTRLWAPGLNEGYVPQGLALMAGAVLVSAYRPARQDEYQPRCRVFRVDPATGAVTGWFDVPPECSHAGGLAYDGAGRLYVVDTQVVLAVDLAKALESHDAARAVTQTLHLGGDVRGSLSTFHGGALWIGSWNPGGPGAIFRFPQPTLLAMGKEAKLNERNAAQRVELPSKAQGAAFDEQGRLWVALSNTKRGQLWVVDGKTGALIDSFDMTPGIEGIAFAAPNRLWAVAEVGSQRWLAGNTFHPLVFALDPAQLK